MRTRRRDPFTAKERSALMAKVRSRGNRSTEMRLIEILRAAQLTGWRRHANLPGRPDFSFREHKVAIFVDGCFWHGCAKCYRRPTVRQAYWDAKVQRNMARDRAVARELRARGWRCVRVWEHQIKKAPLLVGRRIARLLR